MHRNPERCQLENVIPLDLCRELVFLHKSLGVVGYRPGVRSTTIHDVLASAPPLLLPLVRARGLVLDAVESALGLECQLFVEFTGLISWSKGSSIGWHHDSNREYLAQRAFAAVLYLNDSGIEFDGGDFRFRDGEPTHVTPKAGRVVAYSAGESNIHCVEEVEWGERFTLTMWFTREVKFCEDPTLIATCSNVRPGINSPFRTSTGGEKSCLEGEGLVIPGYNHAGLPSEMYVDGSGVDIRNQRLDAFEMTMGESETEAGCIVVGRVERDDTGDKSKLQWMTFFNSKCHGLLVLHFGEWQELKSSKEGPQSWVEFVDASREGFDQYLLQSTEVFEKCCRLWVEGGMVSGVDGD